MKTKIELELEIINITAKIHDKFPELSQFVSEMPTNNSNNEAINLKNLDDYLHSLEDVVKKYVDAQSVGPPKVNSDKTVYADLQIYPPSEDIYQQFKEESDLNPEDISKKKTLNEKVGLFNKKRFGDVMSGNDLDVPGSELDDQQESVGSEDEENNYYSIGGDNHNDLDEDKI